MERRRLFGSFFDAAGADFFLLAADLFGLQVDAELAQRFDVGMADLVSGLCAALADGTDFTHGNEFRFA